jgi:formylglycine-generating enzyme required for sulfatase activity
MARYPITNAQYQCFIDDEGYETDAWWEGLADRPKLARPRWDYPNHPRETVSWYESIAFSRWLDARLRAAGSVPDGSQVRLPTDQEWEKAARGKDGRGYPWGEGYQRERANIKEIDQLDQTSAVGIYPQGASPCGAFDMAGNVWEWCLNSSDKRTDTSSAGDAARVLCGGSWVDHSLLCGCADR